MKGDGRTPVCPLVYGEYSNFILVAFIALYVKSDRLCEGSENQTAGRRITKKSSGDNERNSALIRIRRLCCAYSVNDETFTRFEKTRTIFIN